MMRSRKQLGNVGETLAVQALRARGYEILACNWRCARGEIDIVARDGDCYAMIEVKTRRGHGSEYPEDGLTPAKARRLVALAQTYLAGRGLDDVDWRIDLVAIELDGRGQVARLDVIAGVAVDG
jgi:putative endonuclease